MSLVFSVYLLCVRILCVFAITDTNSDNDVRERERERTDRGKREKESKRHTKKRGGKVR